MNERTITLIVTNLDTIKDIKGKVQKKIGICVDQHPLLLEGEQLQDDRVITYYDITQESLLEINLGSNVF